MTSKEYEKIIRNATDKEYEKIAKDIREFTKKVTSSKTSARNFLVSAGICTTSGKLAKAYR